MKIVDKTFLVMLVLFFCQTLIMSCTNPSNTESPKPIIPAITYLSGLNTVKYEVTSNTSLSNVTVTMTNSPTTSSSFDHFSNNILPYTKEYVLNFTGEGSYLSMSAYATVNTNTTLTVNIYINDVLIKTETATSNSLVYVSATTDKI